MLAIAIAISASAFAQAPTDAQREAIRSACRSDYIAHCSSVPPGGLESLQCLQKNMSSLSGSCKSAVNAMEAPAAAPAAKSETPAAAPKAETPAAAEPAKPAATAAPAPRLPRRRQYAATNRPTPRSPRSAVPAAPIIQKSARACRPAALRRCNAWTRTSRRSRQAVSRRSTRRRRRCASGGAGSTGAPAGAAAPAAAPATIVLRPMRPREELFVLRSACGGDVRSLCGRGGARRRPHRAMPGYQRRLAIAGVQGCVEPVQGAVRSGEKHTPTRRRPEPARRARRPQPDSSPPEFS